MTSKRNFFKNDNLLKKEILPKITINWYLAWAGTTGSDRFDQLDSLAIEIRMKGCEVQCIGLPWGFGASPLIINFLSCNLVIRVKIEDSVTKDDRTHPHPILER